MKRLALVLVVGAFLVPAPAWAWPLGPEQAWQPPCPPEQGVPPVPLPPGLTEMPEPDTITCA